MDKMFETITQLDKILQVLYGPGLTLMKTFPKTLGMMAIKSQYLGSKLTYQQSVRRSS